MVHLPLVVDRRPGGSGEDQVLEGHVVVRGGNLWICADPPEIFPKEGTEALPVPGIELLLEDLLERLSLDEGKGSAAVLCQLAGGDHKTGILLIPCPELPV